MDDAQLMKALERDDSYRVIRVLADVPTGKTELVRGPGAGPQVRKYVPRELANERAWKVLAAINHPLLPQVRDLYWLPDCFVVVTTYVDGISLGELVESTGPLMPAEAVRYLADLCEAAGELHAHGIVHRDISPGNAVVAAGRAALIDLGNVHAYVEGAERDTTTLGTWGFAAPEQYGFAQTDARSDVYALGGLLAYLLTGIKPGDDGFDQALADEQRVPRDLRVVVQKARAFEPSARYQTASELVEVANAAVARSVVVPIDLDSPMQSGVSFTPATPKVAVRQQSTEPVSEPMAATPEPAEPAEDPFPMRLAKMAWREIKSMFSDWLAVGFYTKLGLIAMWLFCLPLAGGFLAAGFSPSRHTKPGDFITYPATSIICTACLALMAREIQKASAAKAKGEVASLGPLVLKAFIKWTLITIVAAAAAVIPTMLVFGAFAGA